MDSPTLEHIPSGINANVQTPQMTLTVAFHPDTTQIGKQYQTSSKQVEISRLSPLFSFGENLAEQSPLADPYISRTPIVLQKETSHHGSDNWLLSKKNSSTNIASTDAQDIDSLRISDSELEDGISFMLGGRIVLVAHLTPKIQNKATEDLGIIGVSEAICKVRDLIHKVASLKMPVLIRGESGTGKELVAQAVHSCSPRNVAKLVSINMGAISKELVSAELFGSVKGAFTGAVSRKGCFLEANNSTLFLDEIGEAPIEVQVALLRILETGVLQAVGSEQVIPLNVRIIASTDANLEALIGQESFRMPLLQRLSGLVIEMPSLRQRREDICCILRHFLLQSLRETGQLNKLLHSEPSGIYFWAWFFAQCSTLEWPGNVRQLKNVATQLSVALMSFDDISCFDWQHFVATVVKQSNIAEAARNCTLQNKTNQDHIDQTAEAVQRKPRNISDEEVLTTLQKNHWQIKQTADALNISRTALYQKIDASEHLRRASDISTNELQKVFNDCDGSLDKMVLELKISKQALTRRLHELGLHASEGNTH